MAVTPTARGPKVPSIRPIVRDEAFPGVENDAWRGILAHRSKGIPMEKVNPALAGQPGAANGFTLGTKVAG